MNSIGKLYKSVIVLLFIVVVLFGILSEIQNVNAQNYSNTYIRKEDCINYQVYRELYPLQCGLLLLTSKKTFDWPFNIDGLILGDQASIFDYIMGLLGIGIIFASILGIIFGLRIIFFQWIYYADQYNEDKLKEIKKKAWYIALGWGALVIGFVIVTILNNQFGTDLL